MWTITEQFIHMESATCCDKAVYSIISVYRAGRGSLVQCDVYIKNGQLSGLVSSLAKNEKNIETEIQAYSTKQKKCQHVRQDTNCLGSLNSSIQKEYLGTTMSHQLTQNSFRKFVIKLYLGHILQFCEIETQRKTLRKRYISGAGIEAVFERLIFQQQSFICKL